MNRKATHCVHVAFPHPPHLLTYAVPDRLEIQPGFRVLVPMGKRLMMGFVVETVGKPEIDEVKEIEDVLDPYPVLSPEMLSLTQWVAGYYIANWGEVIRCALPPGLQRKNRLMIRRTAETAPENLTRLETDILSRLSSDASRSVLWLEKIVQSQIRYPVHRLAKMGLVELTTVLEDSRVSARKTLWVVGLKDPDPELQKAMASRAPAQLRILESLKAHGGRMPRKEIPGNSSSLKKLSDMGFVALQEVESFRDPYTHISKSPNTFTLTGEQKTVLDSVQRAISPSRFEVFLLHGVTASGKTQVYIEAIRKALDMNKSALVLIPEISLTPQAVQRYKGAFGEVAVLHSRLSQGERYDAWRGLREGRFRIALGPRSAVFAPMENLGLIVVDEEHETSYKQMDPSPRYHARDVAVVRAKLNCCPVILGSATPSLESYRNSLNGKYTLCEMKSRIDFIPLPKVAVINRSGDKDPHVLSRLLQEKIRQTLENGEQVILLQNRRGYSALLLCSACGFIDQCPECDIALTYHRIQHRLLCHYCGFEKSAPDACSICGGSTLAYRGIGTQRVEEELQSLFPGTRILRMDLDTTRRKGSHDKIIFRFEKGEGDILIGTQMVAKGHDFPGVRLVGVISADTGMHFPDFRAGEKTFQLLTQAAGRAGRRDQPGEVVIQTYSPDHPSVRFAAAQDYPGFFHAESGERKELNYPPWGHLALLRIQGEREDRVKRAAETIAGLVPKDPKIEVLGPAPCPLSRIKSQYRYQMILRSARNSDPAGALLRSSTRTVLDRVDQSMHLQGIRLQVDVDPQDMM